MCIRDRACAEQSRRHAKDSQLANVRERHLSSAAAWEAIADRTEKTEASRLARQPVTTEPPAAD